MGQTRGRQFKAGRDWILIAVVHGGSYHSCLAQTTLFLYTDLPQ